MKYHRFQCEKLVRDRTPERLAAGGCVFDQTVLTMPEYQTALKAKLREESQEVFEAKTPEQILEELADVLEVAHALCAAVGFSLDDVERVRRAKVEKRGAFHERLYIKEVAAPENSPNFGYYKSNPRAYPYLGSYEDEEK